MAFNDQTILANLSHLTHQRTGFKGAMLEPEGLERDCPLDNGRHDGHEISVSLGCFGVLPTELLYTIFLELDLRSLTGLRSVNRRMRQIIDSLWQYREIITHAPNSFRAILTLEVDATVSCRQLHKELCSKKCVTCGHFGAFLYLLTCSRVCYVCLVENPRFLPITKGHAMTAFGLTVDATSKLPFAHTIPGVYSQRSTMQRRRIVLVDRTSSRLAGIDVHKSVEQMEEYVLNLQAKTISSHEISVRASQIGGYKKPPRPAYTAVVDKKGANPHRFMCVVRFPWFDRQKGEAEWGLNCRGCRDQLHDRTNEKLDCRWLYTVSEYLVHARQCRKSIEMLELLIEEENLVT